MIRRRHRTCPPLESLCSVRRSEDVARQAVISEAENSSDVELAYSICTSRRLQVLALFVALPAQLQTFVPLRGAMVHENSVATANPPSATARAASMVPNG